MECVYCGKEWKNSNSLKNHERQCKENPNRQLLKSNFIEYNKRRKELGIKGTNQFIKAAQEGKQIEVSDETRKKLSDASKGRRYTEERKIEITEMMRRVVRENPDSYSASNVNGRTKKVVYRGETLDSRWEYEFVKWCDDNQVKWCRNKTPFEYEWCGKRLYFPDFYLYDYDLYVEVKGYERERDREKWKVVPNLMIVKVYEINLIRQGKFNLDWALNSGV